MEVIALALLTSWVSAAETEVLSGKEIVQRCHYKYAGDDQRSHLLVTSELTNGKKISSEYIRLWKNYGGKDGVVDKVILYTTSAHNQGLAFMRWGYVKGSKRLADQWVYLPETRVVKRISKRTPDEMDWGFSDDDLHVRDIDEDDHRFIEVRTVGEKSFYVVESRPKHDHMYGKRIVWFSKEDDWKRCVESRIDYFDKEMKMVKTQRFTWQNIEGVWAWKTAVIKNFRADSTTVYEVTNIEVNVGLKDREFTARALARGYQY